MPRWLRVIRGMVGVGLTFAAGVGVVASVVFVLPTLLRVGGDAGLEMLVMVIKSSIWAFPIGVAFSGVLAITARGRPFDKLSLPRFAALGAGGGLLLYGLLAINAWQAWSVSDAIANLMIFVLLGGGSATATLMLARKAGPALTSGEEPRSLDRCSGAGFSDRILFGSDAGLKEGIDAILDADFLTEQQKRDILCNNAARFLKIDGGICE